VEEKDNFSDDLSIILTDKDIAKAAKLLYSNKTLDKGTLATIIKRLKLQNDVNKDKLGKIFENLNKFIESIKPNKASKDVKLDFHSINTFDKIFSRYLIENNKEKSIKNLKKLFELNNILLKDQKIEAIYEAFKDKNGKYYDSIVLDNDVDQSLSIKDEKDKHLTKIIKYYFSDYDRFENLVNILITNKKLNTIDYNKIKETFYGKTKLDMKEFRKVLET